MRRQRHLVAALTALIALGAFPPTAAAVPPVAVDDAASVDEDDPPTTVDVLANDTDGDEVTLSPHYGSMRIGNSVESEM